MKAVHFSETSVNLYQTTRSDVAEKAFFTDVLFGWQTAPSPRAVCKARSSRLLLGWFSVIRQRVGWFRSVLLLFRRTRALILGSGRPRGRQDVLLSSLEDGGTAAVRNSYEHSGTCKHRWHLASVPVLPTAVAVCRYGACGNPVLSVKN
jgi:hypothetical protein